MSGTAAEWVAIAVSCLVGIGGLLKAFHSDHRAKEAVREAEKANEIARNANAISERANEISVDANKIAQDANTLVERQAAVQNREATVKWEGHWEKAGLYRIVNIGNEPAIDVSAKITVDQFVAESTAEHVGRSEHFDVWMPDVRKQHLREQEQNRTPRRSNPLGFTVPHIADPFANSHALGEYIVYSTEDGKQLVHDKRYKFSSIDPG